MLASPLILPPLLLVALLVISGVAKLRHPQETRSAFDQLQLPRALSDSPAPRVLPWAEIALAAALLVAPPPFALGVGAIVLALFVAYLAVIVRALGFDYPVTCSCFGRLGLGEVTQRTALRNVLLVVAAALTLRSTTAGASVAARLVTASATTWAWLGLVVLTLTVVVVTFGGTKGAAVPASPTASRDEGEAADYRRQPLPFAALEDEKGQRITLDELTAAGAVLLVFVAPGCGSCRPLIERLAEWDQALGPVRVRAVVSAPVESAVASAPSLAGLALRDPQAATARIFRVSLPGAVLLGGDGLLAGGPVPAAEVNDFYEEIRAELLDAGVIEDAGVRGDAGEVGSPVSAGEVSDAR